MHLCHSAAVNAMEVLLHERDDSLQLKVTSGVAPTFRVENILNNIVLFFSGSRPLTQIIGANIRVRDIRL